MRQEAYRRLLEDAQIFKVCLAHHILITNDPYIKIYDLSFKVTQRLTRYLALDVTSLEKAEKLFRYESEGLAGFACRSGLMNGRTPAEEQERLRAELLQNRGPLVLHELLREVMDLPTPPDFVPSTLPPCLYDRLVRAAYPSPSFS